MYLGAWLIGMSWLVTYSFSQWKWKCCCVCMCVCVCVSVYTERWICCKSGRDLFLDTARLKITVKVVKVKDDLKTTVLHVSIGTLTCILQKGPTTYPRITSIVCQWFEWASVQMWCPLKTRPFICLTNSGTTITSSRDVTQKYSFHLHLTGSVFSLTLILPNRLRTQSPLMGIVVIIFFNEQILRSLSILLRYLAIFFINTFAFFSK